jgi:outer membrane protein OmpA-like peptidoglycan-associated protein
MKKILYVLLFTLIGITSVYAQTKEKPWNLGLYYGRSEYDGDLGSGFFQFNKAFYGYGHLSLSRYLNSWFNLAINGSYGGHGYYDNNDANAVRFGAHKVYGDIQVQFNFIEKESALFRPYIFAGIGFRDLTEITGSDLVPPPTCQPGYDLVIPGGIGINFRIYKGISIRYIATVGWTNHDNRDTKPAGDNNDWQLDQSLGFTFSLGSSKDTDGDGVVDKKDKCPDTPEGALVDADGCVIDKDKDGIADNQDECPDLAGIAKFKGCPDTDGDGVPDKDDKCPKVAGPVITNGCPDRDNDGVVDDQDECPDAAGPAALAGCPDRDGDGVPDIKDNCPDLAGLAQYGGCPYLDTDGDGIKDADDMCPDKKGPPENKGCPYSDSDGDGVIDSEDHCPLTPGDPANFGCPVLKVEEAAILKTAFENLEFETAKAVIRSSSFASMDELAALLKSKPAWKLKISGHTDNVGSDASNMTLSKNRAQSTANYLTGKGVPQSQLIVEWFGESMPIADNNTAEGRQTNRRVEMQVVFD